MWGFRLETQKLELNQKTWLLRSLKWNLLIKPRRFTLVTMLMISQFSYES